MRAVATRCRGVVGRVKGRVVPSGPSARWAAIAPRTQGIVIGAGSCGLVFAILGALLLGPLSGHGASGPAATPRIAAASPSATPAAAASGSASVSPSASSSASPRPQGSDDGVSPRVPSVLATVDCKPDYTPPVSSGGRLYVSCSAGVKVVAIDLATDKIAQTYLLNGPVPTPPNLMIVDRGLWLSFASADIQYVERLDLGTGLRTTEFQDSTLLADTSGTIWMSNGYGDIMKVNPAKGTSSISHSTNAVAVLGDSTEFVNAACGMIWGQNAAGDILRVNPATDALIDMGRPQDTDALVTVLQSGSTCWGVLDTLDGSGEVLARLGTSCADMVTSKIDSDPSLVGDTYWLFSEDGTYINQVEPFGGAQGRHWLVPTIRDGWVTTANGQVWIANLDGLTRMDIPLDKMSPGAAPRTLSCPAPHAPTAVASATPTRSPLPTPVATGSETPAP